MSELTSQDIAEVAYEKTLNVAKQRKVDYRKYLQENVEEKALNVLSFFATHDSLTEVLQKKVKAFNLLTASSLKPTQNGCTSPQETKKTKQNFLQILA